MQESYLVRLRRIIEDQYGEQDGDFGVLLCREIHTNNLTFKALAEKWGISLSTLGELICDHCKRLQEDPVVRHNYGMV